VAYDVTDVAAVRTAIDGIAGTVGPVDIFVSNAGVPSGASMQRPFLEHTPDTWRTEVDLSLYGAVHGLHAVLPGMIERGWGRVIVISSGAAAQGLRIGVSMYGAAKAAVEGLVRHVAVEVARNGVTVNALALGLMDNVAGVASSDELLRSLARNIPVGRLGSGDEVGGACTWLAGDDGAWVTGQVIHINGGGLFGR
jgi:NAD(P)-dependent dehydrogenase (short-subunit alcohol dehydrogenase family)